MVQNTLPRLVSWPSQTLLFPCANLQIPIPFSIPGEQGWPVLSTYAVGIGAAMGVTASVNSIGCYLLCSKALKNPPPLRHSCNRGLCAEGLGSLLSAVLGSMSGTASSMSNTCASSLTQVTVWGGPWDCSMQRSHMGISRYLTLKNGDISPV